MLLLLLLLLVLLLLSVPHTFADNAQVGEVHELEKKCLLLQQQVHEMEVKCFSMEFQG